MHSWENDCFCFANKLQAMRDIGDAEGRIKGDMAYGIIGEVIRGRKEKARNTGGVDTGRRKNAKTGPRVDRKQKRKINTQKKIKRTE